MRDVLNRTAPRRFGVLDPLKVVIDELPRGPGRDDGGRQQPRGPVGRDAPGGVLARAVDRARRLHGGAAAEVLPPRARARGAAAERLLRHLPGGREGRGRARRRAALHVRPGHARRRRARRPAAQGDAPLGLGRARRAGRGPALRPPLRAPRPGRRRRPVRRPQPGVGDDRPGRDARARPGRRRRSARRSSSSGSATSRRTPTRGRAPWCSTGR